MRQSKSRAVAVQPPRQGDVSHTALIAAFTREVGAEWLPDTDQYMFRFNINSETSTRVYTVAYRKRDGVWCCKCMGWIRNHHGGQYWCKHLTAMRPGLERLSHVARGTLGQR